jgi:uncharacterized protein YggE
MIKTSLLVAGIFSLSAAFAQTTANHIELVVSESVELKPTEAEIRISVQTAQSQRESLGYDYGYSEYDYGYSWLEPTDEDYAYEQLMYENPKKVTKKMTEEYEARQKQREAEIAVMEKDREELLRQREIEMASFEATDVEAVMAILTENGISFTIVTEPSEMEDRYEFDYDDWSDEYYEMETYYSDSVLSVKVIDAKAYENLLVAIDDLPVYSAVYDVKFEASETINSTVIPKLTEKATKEAQALANSFGRKLGKVIQCSNIHPYTPSENYMKSYVGDAMDFLDGDSNYSGEGDPFSGTKKEIVEYVYRFELLN